MKEEENKKSNYNNYNKNNNILRLRKKAETDY